MIGFICCGYIFGNRMRRMICHDEVLRVKHIFFDRRWVDIILAFV